MKFDIKRMAVVAIIIAIATIVTHAGWVAIQSERIRSFAYDYSYCLFQNDLENIRNLQEISFEDLSQALSDKIDSRERVFMAASELESASACFKFWNWSLKSLTKDPILCETFYRFNEAEDRRKNELRKQPMIQCEQ